ncbi:MULTISPECIES: hypothetical protein [unclassified Myroides]|uniref:hypothetical protein n=1 Tax=unclassified Myroides TaxID=2642485 RepID=UPI003D2F7BB7
MTALEEYLLYENSDRMYLYRLRLTYLWDQKEFNYLVQLVRNVLKEFENNTLFPKQIRYFFTSDIDQIIGIVSNPLFIVNIPDSYDKSKYIDTINSGIAILNDLKEEFFYGEI